MTFDSTYRYFAFTPDVLQSATDLRDGFGELANTAPDHKGMEIKTLLCGLDNVDTGKLRAMQLGVDAVPVALTDGRMCLGGYWALPVKAAFENGDIAGNELTVEQVKELQPTSAI
jgi:hypothetical protein